MVSSVDDAEIDRFGLAAHHRIHVFDGHAEHFARRHGVNVETFLEGGFQGIDVGHVGQYAQLDLAVVRADEHVAFIGNEGFADLAAFFCPHRDVLKVRIG